MAGEVHAASAPVDVAKRQAGIGDGGVIDDRHEARRIAHQRLEEQRLVAVAQAHEIDVALEVAGLGVEMPHHPLDLSVQGLDAGRQQALDAVLAPLLVGEGGALVEDGVVEQVQIAVRLGGCRSGHQDSLRDCVRQEEHVRRSRALRTVGQRAQLASDQELVSAEQIGFGEIDDLVATTIHDRA